MVRSFIVTFFICIGSTRYTFLRHTHIHIIHVLESHLYQKKKQLAQFLFLLFVRCTYVLSCFCFDFCFFFLLVFFSCSFRFNEFSIYCNVCFILSFTCCTWTNNTSNERFFANSIRALTIEIEQ